MRLVDNGDGTVTDKSTNLMWQKEPDGAYRNWNESMFYCEELDLTGYDDWRPPTVKELQSIVDYNFVNPAIDIDYFPKTSASCYWSSSTYANNISLAWTVGFGYGYVSVSSKANNNNVRAVRDI